MLGYSLLLRAKQDCQKESLQFPLRKRYVNKMFAREQYWISVIEDCTRNVVCYENGALIFDIVNGFDSRKNIKNKRIGDNKNGNS